MKIDWDLLNKYLSKQQDIGTSVRYTECPFCRERVSRKGFVVTRTPKGYLCWCHRCHQSYKTGGKTPGLKDCLRIANEQKSKKTWPLRKHDNHQPVKGVRKAIVALPFDVTNEIPIVARLWLMKYHITQEEVQKYGICWSPSLSRLILPVRDSCGRLLYWQGRYFGSDDNQPKYYNTKTTRKEVWFDTGGDSPVIVLTEDILSAIAVARTSSYRAVALLGSYVSDDLILKLLSEGKQVCVWLDLDKRCQSVKYSKRLQVFGINAKSIVTKLDPKEYTPQQIDKEVHHAYPDLFQISHSQQEQLSEDEQSGQGTSQQQAPSEEQTSQQQG